MNPWISEQLAAAHRDELRRAAAGLSYPRSGPSGPAKSTGHFLDPRKALGGLLIRAGTRLAGAGDVRLSAGPPGVVC